MKQQKLMAVLMIVMLCVSSAFAYVSVPLKRNMIDAVYAWPPGTTTGQTLQNAYDYITSSDRDAAMGTLGVLNQRTLVLTAGNYSSTALVLDTNYVNILALGDATISDTSGVVIDCGGVICTITGVRLDASSLANGLSNESQATLNGVYTTDGSTTEIFYGGGGVTLRTLGPTSSQVTFNEFNSVGVVSTKTSGGGAATGTTGDENLWLYPMDMFEYHILGTQTILQPVLATGGVNIGLDQVDNDGLEIGQGITAQSNRAFTVGTDAFYIKVQFSVAVINGTDDMAVGFRKIEAYNAVLETYTDMAALGFNAADGDIMIRTSDDGSNVNTDTTDQWADTETHTFGVFVTDAGVVTYTIDGAAPTTTAAFTIDDTDVVVPFLFMLQANGVQTGAVVLKSWECGLQ